MIAEADVVASKPIYCGCGAIVIEVLVNYPDKSRKWVACTWSQPSKAWQEHTCARAGVRTL